MRPRALLVGLLALHSIRPVILNAQSPPSGLQPGVSTFLLHGSIVDPEGKPVAGASIEASKLDAVAQVLARLETTSTRDGTFQIAGCPTGFIAVKASHPDFTDTWTNFTVAPPPTAKSLRLTMRRGGRIVGTVRGRDGRALPTADVSFHGMGDTRKTIQSAGSFVFPHVAPGPGTAIALTGPAGPDRRTAVQELTVEEGKTVTADLVMSEVLVSGRVTRSGAPGAGLRVTLLNRTGSNARMTAKSIASGGQGPGVGNVTLTDQDGAFTVLADAPGPAYVQIATLQYDAFFPSQEIDLPDSDTYFVELAVGATTGITGIVTSAATGEPVAGARVSALARPQDSKAGERLGKSGGSVQTDADGRFVLEVASGEYTLTAEVDRDSYWKGTVPASVPESGRSEVPIVVDRTPEIRVRVIDATGRPVAHALLGVCDATGRLMRQGHSTTDADGRFRLKRMEQQPYNIFALEIRSGVMGFRSEVRPGLEEVAITLRSASKVTVRAIDPEGRPVEGAEVWLRTLDGHAIDRVHRGTTDGRGVVVLSVPPGAVEIAVHGGNRGALEGRGATEVPQGGEGNVTVAMVAAPAPDRRGNR